MADAALVARLLALRSEIDALIVESGGTGPSLAKGEPDAEWMTIGRYCQARSIPRRTLHDRIREGLPTIGEGRDRRVIVAEADAWLAKRKGRAA